MMGTLLESRAVKQRRKGGAALSVAMHAAIISAAVAATTQDEVAAAKPPHVDLVYVDKPHLKSQVVPPKASTRFLGEIPNHINIIHVDPPRIIPTEIPAIDLTATVGSNDMIVVGSGERGRPTSLTSAIAGTGGAPDEGNDWKGADVFTHVLAQGKPHYPESLRSAGVDGRVVIQFIVDTAGRVDMSSVRVLSSTHDLFSRAVHDALGQFRFRPAELHGKKTAALAEMPFEFQLTNR